MYEIVTLIDEEYIYDNDKLEWAFNWEGNHLN